MSLSRSGLATYPGHVVAGKSDHVACVRGYEAISGLGIKWPVWLKFHYCVFSHQTKARARLELREVATEQDAKDVVEVMKFRWGHTSNLMYTTQFRLSGICFHSMYDTYSDEFGMVDFQRSQHGSGMSQRSQVWSNPQERAVFVHKLGNTSTVQCLLMWFWRCYAVQHNLPSYWMYLCQATKYT